MRGARSAARILSSVFVTLFGLLALTFFMGRMLPVDPVAAIIGPTADQSTYDMVRHQLGLDRPITTQFAIYIRHMLSGDFGKALFTGHPVASDLARAFPATLELASFAIIIGVALGVPLGVLAAVYRGSADRPHRALRRPARLFQPGLLARADGPRRVLRHARLGRRSRAARRFLSRHRRAENGDAADRRAARRRVPRCSGTRSSHIVLPGSILGFGSMAYISRMTRSFMLEQLGQEYIVAARAQGACRAGGSSGGMRSATSWSSSSP